MKKQQRRRKGRLIQRQKRLTDNSKSYRVVGILDGSDLKAYGIYPTFALAQQVALAKRYEESRMTCFVYTDDNRVVFSTEGKE